MSYSGRSWGKPVDPRELHEKTWHRAKAIGWDDKWQALSLPARRAYLLDLKGPTKAGSVTNPSTLAEKIPEPIIAELTKAGFIEVEAAKGKKSAKIVPTQALHDFSARLRAAHRYHVLGPPNRDELAKSIKYAFLSQGEPTVHRVLAAAGMDHFTRLEEALELYVATRRWPEWALESCKSAAARPLLEALIKAKGPVPLHRLPVVVKGYSPKDLERALTELIASLAAFEDVDPETFELVVGILPEVRDDLEEAKKPRSRPPLVVCKNPKEIGPPGGLEVNDLRVFLLEVASESPRLRQDGGIFAKDEPRLQEALPARPAWIYEALKSSGEHRLELAYTLARTLNFVDPETEDKSKWLRLSGKGRSWLAAGFEEQYAKLYEHYRAVPKKKSNVYYDDFDDDGYNYGYNTFGDSLFLGVPVSVEPFASQGSSNRAYYHFEDVKPERREALRAALLEAFRTLPVGVFHVWDSVLDNLCYGVDNPLIGGEDPARFQININRRPVPRMTEQVETAARFVLDVLLRMRLLPLDAVEAAVDAEGRLCIARLPRLEGYFGKPYQADPASPARRAA